MRKRKCRSRLQTPQEMRTASLAIIRKEVQRLNRLLTNLLDFARPRKPEFQTVHADRLIDAIIALAGHAAQQKSITLHKDVPANVPAFECDPEQMKQVLLNLAINAVQAMTGAGDIVLAARQLDSSVVIAAFSSRPCEDKDFSLSFITDMLSENRPVLIAAPTLAEMNAGVPPTPLVRGIRVVAHCEPSAWRSGAADFASQQRLPLP